MARETKKPVKAAAEIFLLPKGRLINSSLFEPDQFNDQSKPSYKAEIAFEKSNTEFDKVLSKVDDFAVKEHNLLDDDRLNIDGGTVISGVLDGDKLAKKRERDGKPGDAYKGCWVVRCSTGFNKDGIAGPGGIAVFDEDTNPITIANAGAIYNGCYVQAAVTLSAYDDKSGEPGVKFYLSAVQKVGDGEKLASARDYSTLFQPARTAASTGRRSR